MNIPLHALGVIDVARVTVSSVPEADSSVIRCCDKFFTRGAKFDIHDSGNVVLEDIQSAVGLSHIKDISVVILIGHGKVEGFHRVPCNGIGGELQDHLVYW